jgi:hypothetical protein
VGRSSWNRRIRAYVALTFVAIAAAFAVPVSSASATTSVSGLMYGGGYAQSAPDMEAVARSGAHYWRIGMGCTEGWAAIDKEVELAWRHGLAVIAYVQSECEGSRQFPPYEAGTRWSKWETWLYELVHRYGSSGEFWSGKSSPDPIMVWELWNEENHGNNNPGGVTVSPAKYGGFLRRSAASVKAAQHEKDPSASPTILMGGLITSANGSEGGFETKTVKAFLKEMYEATPNAMENVSGMGLHPYAFGPGSAAQVETNIKTARENLDEHASGLPIWITEFGWPVNPPATSEGPFTAVNEEQQALLLGEVMGWFEAEASSKHLSALVYYFYRDINWDSGRWDGFTGLRREPEPAFAQKSFRPAWATFQSHTGAASWPVPSSVSTEAATELKLKSSRIPYSVNPHGLSTHFKLEWGTTTSYGESVALPEHWEEATVSGSQAITNLVPGATYHYRVVATNENAEVSGSADRTFTTAGGRATAIVDSEGRTHLFFRASSGGLEEWSQSGSLWRHRVWGTGGTMAGKPSAVLGPEGKIFVYYRTSTDQLAEWWFKGTEWGYEVRGVGGDIGGDPSAFVDTEGRRWVYFRSPSGQLRAWWFKGSGWGHEELGYTGNVEGTPSAFLGPEGKRFVYYRTSNGQLGEWWFKGSGWGHEERGYYNDIASDPSAFVGTEGRNWVYFSSPSGQLRAWWFKGSEWGHEELGYTGIMEGTPSAFLGPEGRRYVYYLASDGQLGEWWFKGAEWGQREVGYHEALKSLPTAVSTGKEASEVFYFGEGDTPYRWVFAGGGLNLSEISSPPVKFIPEGSAVVDAEGEPHLFYRGPAENLNEWYQAGSTWKHREWGSGGTMAGKPSAVLGPEGKIFVYYRTPGGQLAQWWIASSSEWGYEVKGSAGDIASDPSAFVDSEGHRWVYFSSPSGQLRAWWFKGIEWGHQELGYTGNVAGTPSAFLGPEGKRFVYYRTVNGQMGEWWFKGSEWGQHEWGYYNDIASNPSAFVDSEGRNWVYFSSPSGQLRAWWFKGSEWGHEELGYTASVVGMPSAVAGPEGRRFVYLQAADGQLGEWSFKGSEWSQHEWGYHEAVAAPPTAVAVGSSERDVFVFNGEAWPYLWSFNGSSWSFRALE